MQGSAVGDQADAIVIGGGTVGGWCAYFLRRSGLARVVLIEKRTLGQGASSRAAGVVRTQGGTPWDVQLDEWSRRFYLGQQDELGIDSGFTRRATCCRASPLTTSPRPASGWPCRRISGCGCAGWSRGSWMR
jgi:choline dehydrogenase-like flavoprotein